MQGLEDLVFLAQLGDGQAYAAIYDRFRDMALAYAMSIVGDYDLAEDARQEAFINAYCDLASLRNPRAFVGWFRTIVFNSSVNVARRRGRSGAALDEAHYVASQEPSAADVVGKGEEARILKAAIERLPRLEREAVRLFYLDSKSLRDVSQALDLPVNTVKGKLHKARAKLRQMISGRSSAKLPREAMDEKKKLAVAASKEAIGQFEKELQTMLSLADAGGQNKITDMICAQARLYRFLGQNEAALAAVQRGLAFPFVSANASIRSRLSAEAGLTYIQLADYARAKQALRTSRGQLPNEQVNLPVLAMVFNGLGICAWGEGAYRKARELYNESLRLGGGKASDILAAETRNNLALLDWKEGRLAAARKNFEACLVKWRRVQCPFGTALAQMHLGIVEEHLGHFIKAEQYYREALAEARQFEFIQVEAAARTNLASLALQNGQWKQALAHSKDALELAGKAKDRRSEAIALENLALAHMGLNDPSHGAEALQRARTLARSIGDKERLFSLELVDVEMLLARNAAAGLGKRFAGLQKKIKALGYHAELPRLLGLRGRFEHLSDATARAARTFQEAGSVSRKQGNKAAERRIRQLSAWCRTHAGNKSKGEG